MKSFTYSVISRPPLFGGLERATIGVILFISIVVMWLTQPFTVLGVYPFLHGIGFIFTRKDPEFMTIALLRVLAFGKGRYEP